MNLKSELLKTGITDSQAEIIADCLLSGDPIICDPEALKQYPTLLSTMHRLATQIHTMRNQEARN